MAINAVHPALIFIIGAIIAPFLIGRLRQAWVVLVPVVGLINMYFLPQGSFWHIDYLGWELTLLRVDNLSVPFGYIFSIMSVIGFLFSMKDKDPGTHPAAFLYSGGALGAIFAGDLLTLFLFCETMAVTAMYLVWAKRTEASYGAGLRYMLVHAFGGVMVMAGVILQIASTGSIEFTHIGLQGLGSWLILLGFGINCAFPILHAWLPDAYPQATITGTIFLSIFTTKTAVYVLARGFAGTELLIWIGVAMAAFPIFFAVIENNLNKVLCYSLINQVGFMVVGIGIGTQLAVNGAVAHAFTNILFEGLLFLCMGAVLHQTGRINATDLGGLYKSMPLTAIFCIIGAASISGFPLFSGFVSKSMIVSASSHEGLILVWLVLLFAAAGVFHHAGIKIPFFAFFSHDAGIKTKEAPLHMLIAMGIAAFLCIFIGVVPSSLYNILPYPVDYVPYTAPHVINQLQLLFFSALAFTLMMLGGIYPAEIRAINVDADWLYRKGARAFMWVVANPLSAIGRGLTGLAHDSVPVLLSWAVKNPLAVTKITADSVLAVFSNGYRRTELEERVRKEKEIYPGDIISHWPIGATVLWVTVFLFVTLLLYYI